MTFSIAARCAKTGQLGIAISSSSIAVGARCPWLRAGVGAVSSQMTEPYVSVGRVRGLGRTRIIANHVMRNASVPLLNLLGIQFSSLLGGVIIVEYIFDYPGLGLLTINAVLQRDFPLIQGIAIVTSAIFVVINIIVDLVATTIDPRLDY